MMSFIHDSVEVTKKPSTVKQLRKVKFNLKEEYRNKKEQEING